MTSDDGGLTVGTMIVVDKREAEVGEVPMDGLALASFDNGGHGRGEEIFADEIFADEHFGAVNSIDLSFIDPMDGSYPVIDTKLREIDEETLGGADISL